MTLTVLLASLAVTRSAIPSRLKSPTATALGRFPVVGHATAGQPACVHAPLMPPSPSPPPPSPFPPVPPSGEPLPLPPLPEPPPHAARITRTHRLWTRISLQRAAKSRSVAGNHTEQGSGQSGYSAAHWLGSDQRSTHEPFEHWYQ